THAQPVDHPPAMPFVDVPEFLRRLRQEDSTAARAAEFAILTCSRRREFIGAKWAEVDVENRVWTVPASRMKARREHRVPLSDAALRVLERQRAVLQNEYVFPGSTVARCSPTAIRKLLKQLGFKFTLHGTARSSFRDWAGETTSFESEVCEAVLAHKLPDATRAAYERGTKFRKR